MKFEYACLALSKLSERLFSEKAILEYADSHEHKIDISELLDNIKEKNTVKDILSAFDCIKSDLLCVIKQQIMNQDEEYKELSALVNSFHKEAS